MACFHRKTCHYRCCDLSVIVNSEDNQEPELAPTEILFPLFCFKKKVVATIHGQAHVRVHQWQNQYLMLQIQ